MAVPYTFGAATASIPLSQLDSNFASTITLGNTAIQLGNTVTILNNMTFANVTVSSGTVSVTTATATTANLVTINATTLNAATHRSDASLVLQTNGTTTAVTIDTSQNVGIGTSSPAAKLDVTNGASPSSRLRVGVGAGAANTLYSTLAAGNYVNFETNGSERARIDSSGVLYTYGGATVRTVQSTTAAFGSGVQTNAISINSYDDASKQFVMSNNNGNTSVFSGNGTAGVNLFQNGSSWSAFSDERIKDIIEPITDAANKVASLRTVIGKYKTDEEGVRRPFLIAQDVQAVLPEAVKVSEDEIGTLNLSYTDMIPLLTAAIQEQQALIQSLTDRLTALEGAK